MEERWIPHFLGMLKSMEQLGSQGSSRYVSIYVDGDGDFHPKFNWDDEYDLPPVAAPQNQHGGNRTYDAG
jgi:hypothetical protein